MPSHPLRVRGLKRAETEEQANVEYVAPFTGAWIETGFCRHGKTLDRVAPFTGAWIETEDAQKQAISDVSHPLRVRGLKRRQKSMIRDRSPSHPLRVRGLKQQQNFCRYRDRNVAPFTGAWIETT